MKDVSLQLTAEILSALAHPNRIKILEFLRGGEKCACEIIPALGMEQSNLSRHMKVLVQSGVLNNWKDAQRVMYEVTDERIFEILDVIKDILRERARKRVLAFEE